MGLKLDDNPPEPLPVIYPVRAKYTNPNYRSVCQVFRDIYRLMDKYEEDGELDSQKVKALLDEGHDCAHRMAKKLHESYNVRMAELIYETKEEELKSVK